MALIQCPACGKMVSENASSCPSCGEPIAAKMNSVVDSGTESFTVNSGTNIQLTAETQAKIQAVTQRLNAEGKTVVSVNTSVPKSGLALLSNDVTIVWNASLGSDRYKAFLYNEAKSLYMSGQYTEALRRFTRLGNYSDCKQYSSKCLERMAEVRKEQDKVRKMEAEIGQNPQTIKNRGYWLYAGWFVIALGAVFILGAIGNGLEYNSGIAWVGVFFIIGGAIPIITFKNKQKEYDKKYEEYLKSKDK